MGKGEPSDSAGSTYGKEEKEGWKGWSEKNLNYSIALRNSKPGWCKFQRRDYASVELFMADSSAPAKPAVGWEQPGEALA